MQFKVDFLLCEVPMHSSNVLALVEEEVLIDAEAVAEFFSEVENFFEYAETHVVNWVLAAVAISEAPLVAPAIQVLTVSVFFLKVV